MDYSQYSDASLVNEIARRERSLDGIGPAQRERVQRRIAELRAEQARRQPAAAKKKGVS